MTLREKFNNVEICIESQLLKIKYDENMRTVDDCIEIAENFAINFANWYEFTLRNNDNLNERFTPKELIEMFKKEKGLPKMLCECGGSERVALDCTLKDCKHPKYCKK